MSKAKTFLFNNIKNDIDNMIGISNIEEIQKVTDAWMDDKNNSKDRFNIIKYYFEDAHKILDMASGAGTFVYYGLLNGYDAHGIDCEEWKHDFIKMKANENNYPKVWQSHFLNGFGEKLPYEDSTFDVASSYQTLEHVSDVKMCLSEMIRVTKKGGGIHIECPDYCSTFEPHYQIAWLPLFPKTLANLYIKARGRNIEYLATLNYVTKNSIKQNVLEIGREQNLDLEIIDINKESFIKVLKKRNLQFLENLYILYRGLQYIRNLFIKEMQVNLIIIKH